MKMSSVAKAIELLLPYYDDDDPDAIWGAYYDAPHIAVRKTDRQIPDDVAKEMAALGWWQSLDGSWELGTPG